MDYVEKREFVLRFELRCEFPPDYEGELDGYEWTGEFRPLAQELLASVVSVVGRHPDWKLRPVNRGRASDEEISFVLERKMGSR